tara:strand:- start:16779 stop:17537 length:759 start_codon:yes stop_codon:yes gene_type:complete
MTENIKTTISTGKNTFDAKGDFLPCGNYYYKINNFKDNLFYGDLSCRGEYGTFCFKPLDLVQMMAIGQSRLARRTELTEDKLPNYDSPVTSPSNGTRRNFLNAQINMRNTSRLNVVNTYTKEEPNKCSICLVDTIVNIKKLHCGHEFHKHCIDSWLSRNNTCPNCRESVRRPPPPPPSTPESNRTRRPSTELFRTNNRTRPISRPIFNNYIYTRSRRQERMNVENLPLGGIRRITRYEEQYLVRENPTHPDD